eukprot:TRINITY_DN24500_c0_g1_i1.p1 TRINITY_DN24500_c0_g1~~TRINITY_DN24500_c0_g1_i1.p1  ORF type:complete len:255 (-),score=35.94 TRINITY_DN24500_c0_g1_i1:195-959(-)
MGQLVDKHPHIVAVDYRDILLHADEDQAIAKLLLSGMKEGKFRPAKRTALPDHYICLLQEFMNRGTVQSWMDENILSPAGLLTVMLHVARALAYMHQSGVTHNDVKPQNILLSEETNGPSTEIIAKLGDLGLAVKSTDRSNDFNQYGMTVFCMTTGEKFGTRKFAAEKLQEFVAEVTELTHNATGEHMLGLPHAAAAAEGTGIGRRRISSALVKLPGLLETMWKQSLVMREVTEYSWLQGWSILDRDVSHSVDA